MQGKALETFSVRTQQKLWHFTYSLEPSNANNMFIQNKECTNILAFFFKKSLPKNDILSRDFMNHICTMYVNTLLHLSFLSMRIINMFVFCLRLLALPTFDMLWNFLADF